MELCGNLPEEWQTKSSAGEKLKRKDLPQDLQGPDK